MNRSVMSLSGGMDSTALLLKMIVEGDNITCISFNYGQKHVVEIDRARANIGYLGENGHNVEHFVVDLRSAMQSLNSALTSDEADVPEGHYESEQMKQTVVPNRNAIFSSIIYARALSTAKSEKCQVRIALGVHSGDHEIYPDCRPEFYESLERSFSLGNWDSEKVSFYLPYISYDKTTILQDALNSCKSLGLDFDMVFSNTNTSYNPDSSGRSSGRSGADVERILAFHSIGRVDPLQYVYDWDTVLNYAMERERQEGRKDE